VDDLSSPDGSLVLFTWYYQRSNEIYVAPLADRCKRHQADQQQRNKERRFPRRQLDRVQLHPDGKPRFTA
jgi:hypothetical protein